MRGGRLVTARKLAERLEVCERTIYRDIADLQSTGVPIDGEAGVGYILRRGFDLPPLMFTGDEVASLVAGARMVRAWGGATMARSALEALVKIEAVLPDSEKARIERTEIHAPGLTMSESDRERLDTLEHAVENRDALSVAYTDLKGAPSSRNIRHLGLWFWGKVWTLVAWCELRNDFRVFRLDRINDMKITGTRFKPEQGRQLVDFYRRMEARECSAGDG